MTDNFGFDEGIDWSKMERDIAEGDDPIQAGPVILSEEMLAKRILWDVSPCDLAEQVRDFLNYSSTSEEVEEKEHQESHLRLENAMLVTPFLNQMAHHAAKAITGVMVVGSGDDIPEAVRDETVEKLEPVIFQAAWAIIAEFLDVGILHLPHVTYFAVAEEEDVE